MQQIQFSIRPPHMLFARHVLIMRATILCLLAVAWAWPASPGAADEPEDPYEVELLHAWEVDPLLEAQWITSPTPPVPEAINVERLRATDRQQRVDEAQRVVTIMRRSRVTNRAETLATLLSLLQEEEPDEVVRAALVAAAAALVEDAEEGTQLWAALASDPRSRKAIEPRLKDWNCPVAVDDWRRILDQSAGDSRDLIVALEGLGVLGQPDDAALVRRVLLRDGLSGPIQLAAASALSQLSDHGLEPLAAQLADSSLPLGPVLAVRILTRHRSPAATRLLEKIVKSGSGAARAGAYVLLAKVDRAKALPLAEIMLDEADSIARRAAIELLNTQDDRGALNLQAKALADRNVHLRRLARAHLEAKAQDEELRQTVIEIAGSFLGSDRFEAIEQAIVLTSRLQLHQYAPRLVRLLDHPRREVSVRAAWALHTLQLDDEVLAEILRRVEDLTSRLEKGTFLPLVEELTGAYLIEALGRHAYRPADATLRKYVPKNGQKMHIYTRTAAIYALGHIHRGSRNKRLADQLAERMLDDNPLDPEEMTVQYVSAIALGRIGHPASIASLQRVPDDPPVPRAVAAEWSLAQLRAQQAAAGDD